MNNKIMSIMTFVLIILISFLPVSHALNISNIYSTVKADEATITFDTDEIAKGQVYFGKTSTLGTDSLQSIDTKSHSITLTNLDPVTKYYFEVQSTDNLGYLFKDTNNGNLYSFTTLDNTPPARPTGVSLDYATQEIISIYWDNNLDSDFEKYLIYRDDINIANSTNPEYVDINLQADKAYRYRVVAVDNIGNPSFSSVIREFRTTLPDFTSPDIMELQIIAITKSTATISWKTNEDASTRIDYGINTNLEHTFDSDNLTEDHVITLTNLVEDEDHFYKVKSCDQNDNCFYSQMHTFRTGEDSSPPFINIDLPEWYNDNRIDLIGTTEPFSKIRLYINDDLVRAITVEGDGGFIFTSVSLDTSLESLNLRLVAEDPAGFQNYTESKMSFDLTPPILTIKDLPPYLNETSLIITGTVDEDVNIDYEITKSEKSESIPEKITGLKLMDSDSNSVELSWDEKEGVAGYLIYRNNKRMTSYTDNYFLDPVLNKASSYTYEISAYDYECREGPRSDSLTISTQSDVAALDDSFDEFIEFCDLEQVDKVSKKVIGSFSQKLDVHEGSNFLKITATDKAGNEVVITKEIIVDIDAPVLTHNLDQLSPSYIRDVTVEGTVTKKPGQKVMVKVKVNGKEYSSLAKKDGTYKVDIELEREYEEEKNTDDDYDDQDKQSSFYINSGTKWINKIEIVAVTESGLSSDMEPGEIELANCGYGSWWKVDLGEPSPVILTPRLMLEGLAKIGVPIEEIKWWSSSQNATITKVQMHIDPDLSDDAQAEFDSDWVTLDYIPNNDQTQGYALITVKKLDNLNMFNEGATTLEKENNLTNHRKGDCIVPGVGCIRIPIMLEIDFAAPTTRYTATGDRIDIDPGRQKQCWHIEIPIDLRAPSDKIPEGLLSDSIGLINDTIELIDTILEPLNTVKEVIFYACAASMLIDFVMAFKESYACEFGSAIKSLGDEGFKPVHAQTGQCVEHYDGDTLNACKDCEEAVRSRKSWAETMHYVCDRIFCPSAPTFQKFVSDNSKQESNSKEPTRSDCAYPDKDKKIKYDEIKNLYDVYKEDSEENECSDLHPHSNECCAYEYMETWDSACLFMDEIKESKCLALENEPTGSRESDSDCGAGRQIWNSLAGFCEADGSEPAELIKVDDKFDKKVLGDKDVKIIVVGLEEKEAVWFRFLKPDQVSRGDSAQSTHYAEIGSIDTDIKSAVPDWNKGDTSRVSSQRVFKPRSGEIFPVDVSVKDKQATDNAKKEFVEKYTRAVKGSDSKTAERAYKKLQESIGVVKKEYVVDPTSSIFRSFQCVCLPGITSYLNLWKKVLEAIRLCFDTVLNTGDGSAGMCKAVLSTYVCDLIYDLISCFTNKFNKGFQREDSGGIGGFFRSISGAGDKVSDSVSSRYGDSAIWKSMFAERKLVHSACLWAFTGTWDFDVNVILEEDISIDVDTIAEMYPCERRFINFNPVSNPTGLTTYNYHTALFMVGGSNIGYTAELICSADYSCDTASGACDCLNLGEQTRHLVIGPGHLKRGETVNEELYENTINTPYRYDKIRLKWWSTDSQKSDIIECNIKDVGGKPPAFCEMDASESKFRCQFDVGETDYIRFQDKPKPSKEIFDVNEEVGVTLNIAQKQPEQSNVGEINKHTKYLIMTLFNANGAEVTKSEAYPFNGNGAQEFYFTTRKISTDDFYKSSNDVKVKVSRNLLRSKINSPLEDDEVHVKIVGHEIKEYYAMIPEGTAKKRKDIAIIPTKIELTDVSTSSVLSIGNDNIFVYFSKVLGGTEITEVTITKTASKVKCDHVPQTWRLAMNFYTAEDIASGNPTQPALYQGEEVKQEIPIKVRCLPVSGVTTLDICQIGQVKIPKCICGIDDGKEKVCTIGNWCNRNIKGERECAEKENNAYTPPNFKLEGVYFKTSSDVNADWNSISVADLKSSTRLSQYSRIVLKFNQPTESANLYINEKTAEKLTSIGGNQYETKTITLSSGESQTRKLTFPGDDIDVRIQR